LTAFFGVAFFNEELFFAVFKTLRTTNRVLLKT